MALPKIDVPIYTVDLLSTGKPVRFRPFTVKEEKLFLMTNETDDVKSMLDTTKQVLNNCVLDEIDVENLPMFDIEKLFLNIRARSVGEVVNLKYKCNNSIKNEKEEEVKCGNLVDVDVNVLEIKPLENKNHSKKIVITENVGVVMKYPSFKLFENINVQDNSESILEMAINCIDYIYDKDNLYYAKDTPKEELIDFVDSLQSKDLEKIKDFFVTMPKLQKNVKFKCNKCGYDENINIEGIESFFV
jgi:hypothetical protein